MSSLDPPLPAPVVDGMAAAWGAVERYGWYALGAVALYLTVWPRVASYVASRRHRAWQERLNLEEERRAARERQQARWEADAARVRAETEQERRDKKHEADAKRKGYDGRRHKMGRSVPAYADGPDAGASTYKPNVRDRYKGRGGGGGG